MEETGSVFYTMKYEDWETIHVNDVSMSDVHRAVNEFICGPGSTMLGLKQEPEDDSGEHTLCQSNANVKETVCSPLGTPRSKRLQTASCSDEDKAVVEENEFNTRGRQNRATNTSKEGEMCKDSVNKSVETYIYRRSNRLAGKVQDSYSEITVKPRPTINYVCPVDTCNLNFTSKRKVNAHVGIKHKDIGFQCMKCRKSYYRFHLLQQHDNEHTGLKPYKCHKCGKRFHSNMHKNAHIRLKHIRPFTRAQCDICGKVVDRSKIRSHINRAHLNKRFKCQECDKEFSEARYLKDHMHMHRGETFECDICKATFVQKRGLLLHINRHYLKLQCPKCNKVFKSKNYLKFHLLQHEGIKKFCCNECGKTFSHAHYLATHKLSHGEKGFQCAICGGKFNRKDNLKAHIIRHQKTGKKDLKKR